MKKSTRILEALEAASQPLTCAEIAAAIDEPDEAKSVGVMMCHLRSTARAEQAGKRGQEALWVITDTGREFLTDVLAEEQDTGASATGAARRVIRAERERRDPDGPPPPRAPKKAARANGHARRETGPALPAVLQPSDEQSIAVRGDGALVVLEGARVVYTLTPELALRVAHLVRRLRAEA